MVKKKMLYILSRSVKKIIQITKNVVGYLENIKKNKHKQLYVHVKDYIFYL